MVKSPRSQRNQHSPRSPGNRRNQHCTHFASGGKSPRASGSPRASDGWTTVGGDRRFKQTDWPRMESLHSGDRSPMQRGHPYSPMQRRRSGGRGSSSRSHLPSRIPAPALFEKASGGRFSQTTVREVNGRTEEQYQEEIRRRDAMLWDMQQELNRLNLSPEERRLQEEHLQEERVLRRAYVLATDPTGSTILVQNVSATDRRRPGRWSMPGGCRNLGEEFDEAANREVREELGRNAFHVPRDADRILLPTGDVVFLHEVVDEFAPPTIIGADSAEIASIAVLSANNVWQLVGDRSLVGWSALNRPTQYTFSERQDLFQH